MADEKNNGEKKNLSVKDKTIIGFTSKVVVIGTKNEKEVIARIDTGAETSSIDMELAADLNLGPILETRFIKSASGQSVRPLIKGKMKIHGKEIEANFTLANRSNLKFAVLIGRNILKKGFIVDPDAKL